MQHLTEVLDRIRHSLRLTERQRVKIVRLQVEADGTARQTLRRKWAEEGADNRETIIQEL